MSVDELLRSRRTVHTFEPQGVPETLVTRAIESARWAPNHKLTEPWEFVIMGGETAAAIAERNAEILREEGREAKAAHKLARWRAVPGWMLLTCRRSEDSFRHQEDLAACACAAQNFMLSLWSAGVASKWTTGPVTRDEQFFQIVGIDPGKRGVVGLFWYGYPSDVPVITRGPLETVLRRLP